MQTAKDICAVIGAIEVAALIAVAILFLASMLAPLPPGRREFPRGYRS